MHLSRSVSTNFLNDPLNQEIRLIQEKLATVEKYFQLLGSTFTLSAKMAARMRDQTDSIAKAVHSYSGAEFDNRTLKNSLRNLANLFVQIGTYRDEEAHLIESVVVKELRTYDESCKPVREELKQLISLRDKQQMRRKHLDRIKERGYRNRQEISAAEVELVKVTGQVQRCTASTEDMVEDFERQKVRDLRSIFQSFLKIQLRYHSKALELLTKGYDIASAIDEDLDVQEFSAVLRADPNLSARHSTVGKFPKTISLTNSIIMDLVNGSEMELPRSSSSTSESETGIDVEASEPPEDKATNGRSGPSGSLHESKDKNMEDTDEKQREEEEGEESEEEGGKREEEVTTPPIAAPRISLGQSASPSPFSSPIASPSRNTSKPCTSVQISSS